MKMINYYYRVQRQFKRRGIYLPAGSPTNQQTFSFLGFREGGRAIETQGRREGGNEFIRKI